MSKGRTILNEFSKKPEDIRRKQLKTKRDELEISESPRRRAIRQQLDELQSMRELKEIKLDGVIYV